MFACLLETGARYHGAGGRGRAGKAKTGANARAGEGHFREAFQRFSNAPPAMKPPLPSTSGSLGLKKAPFPNGTPCRHAFQAPSIPSQHHSSQPSLQRPRRGLQSQNPIHQRCRPWSPQLSQLPHRHSLFPRPPFAYPQELAENFACAPSPPHSARAKGAARGGRQDRESGFSAVWRGRCARRRRRLPPTFRRNRRRGWRRAHRSRESSCRGGRARAGGACSRRSR